MHKCEHFLDAFLCFPVLIFHVQRVPLIFCHLMSLVSNYMGLSSCK